MRGFRMLWASATGWLIDIVLSSFVIGLAMWIAGIEQFQDWDFSNPLHIGLGLILPILMTMIGGGVAGALAPLDAAPAGALVAGLSLILMATSSPPEQTTNDLVALIAQCVAVFLAALAAHLVARRRLQV